MGEKENLSEENLVRKAIRGDVSSFEVLLKKYKQYLYKIAYSYTKNEQDSLDLIQECSYKAWLNIKKLKKHSSFKVWVSRIIVEKVDLQNAIDLLKPEYKTVIILKYFDDMTIDNISEVMDICPNTVKTYLRRAKSSIKSILKEEYLNEM